MRECNGENCQAFDVCQMRGQDKFLPECSAASVKDKIEDVPDSICKRCEACLGGRVCTAFSENGRKKGFACDQVRYADDIPAGVA